MSKEALTFAGAVYQFESSRLNGARTILEARFPSMRAEYDSNHEVLERLGIIAQLEAAAENYHTVTGRNARAVPSERPFIGTANGTKHPKIVGASECEITFLFEAIDNKDVVHFMSVGVESGTLRVRSDTLVGSFQVDQLDTAALDNALSEAYTHHGIRDKKLSDFH